MWKYKQLFIQHGDLSVYDSLATFLNIEGASDFKILESFSRADTPTLFILYKVTSR